MDDKNKTSWLVVALTGTLILGGCLGCGFLIYKNVIEANSSNVIDENKLFIGVAEKNGDQPVELILTAETPNGKTSKSFSSEKLEAMAGQDESLRFYDYAKNPFFDLGGKAIGAWLADENNKLSAQTVALGLLTSNTVSINKSGIWFIDVPTKDGENPGVSHSYYYTTEANQ